MTHLTKLHLVIAAACKVVARLPPVGVVAGSTGEFAPSPPLRWVGLPGYRMAAAISKSDCVNTFTYLFMTGKAEFVNWMDKLAGIFAGVGIMTGLAHIGSNRSMEKLERLELLLLLFVTRETELCLSSLDRIFRNYIERMAGDTLIHTDRAMDKFLISHPPMTGVTGVLLVREIGHLLFSRVHIMARIAERFGISTMEGCRLEILRDLLAAGRWRVIDLGLEALQQLVTVKSLHGQLVEPQIPKGLQNEKIAKSAFILRCAHRQRVAGDTVDGDDNTGQLLCSQFQAKMAG